MWNKFSTMDYLTLMIDTTDELKSISLRKAFSYLKPSFVKTGKLIFILCFITVVFSIFRLAPPYLGKQVFDNGIMANDVGNIMYYGLLTLGTYLLASLIKFGAQALFTIVSNRFSLNLKSQILHKLLRLPIEYFDKQRSGYVVSRVHEADSVASLFNPTVFQFLASLIEAVGAMIIVLSISVQITLVLIPFIPVFIILTTWMSKKIRKNTAILREISAVTVGGVQEVVSGINEIKHYDMEGSKLKEILAKYTELAARNIKQTLFLTAGTGSLGLLNNIVSVVIMIYIGIMITREQLTIGDYVALTGYSMMLLNPVQIFGSLLIIIQPALTSVKRISIFFTPDSETELWGDIKPSSIEGKIQFSNVGFMYDASGQAVLNRCDFTILPGEAVAILGKNGSGKSTILKLILGMYHRYDGSIRIDNIDLHHYHIATLRSKIGIVSQNTFLFKGSLLDNIRIAYPDASSDRLDEVLALSGCNSLFNDGLETISVEEYGKNLSGGQKQAASIARCLLKETDVLLFDEATTHLDTFTKKVVENAIFNTFKDKTRIIITHDINIAQIADRVLKLEKGTINPSAYS